MPIYEYECPKCENRIEKFLKLNEGNSIITIFCDSCLDIVNMKKVISQTTFRLEGRGWSKDGYVDTYEQTKDAI